VLKCRKIFPTENRRNLALFTGQKNFGSLSNCRYCTDRTQNLPEPAPNVWLTLFQISSKSVNFRRSNDRTCELVKAVLDMLQLFERFKLLAGFRAIFRLRLLWPHFQPARSPKYFYYFRSLLVPLSSYITALLLECLRAK